MLIKLVMKQDHRSLFDCFVALLVVSKVKHWSVVFPDLRWFFFQLRTYRRNSSNLGELNMLNRPAKLFENSYKRDTWAYCGYSSNCLTLSQERKTLIFDFLFTYNLEMHDFSFDGLKEKILYEL